MPITPGVEGRSVGTGEGVYWNKAGVALTTVDLSNSTELTYFYTSAVLGQLWRWVDGEDGAVYVHRRPGEQQLSSGLHAANQTSLQKSKLWVCEAFRFQQYTALGCGSKQPDFTFSLRLLGHFPSSCQDIHSINGPIPDSEHVLTIAGKTVKVG